METLNIYLAGGMQKFGKKDFNESNYWRVHIEQELMKLDCGRQTRICNPNDYYSFYDNSPRYSTMREVMEFDLNKVRNSDLIIVNFNDLKSLGTMAELAIAYEHRIPVLGLCSEENYPMLHPCQKEMCNRIFGDIDELIEYVVHYYVV